MNQELLPIVKSILNQDRNSSDVANLTSLEMRAIHFFQKESLFVCFGYQAVFVSKEIFRDINFLKYDQSIEYLELSSGVFKSLIEKFNCMNIIIKIWKKNEKTNTWEIKIEAFPGSYEQLEDAIGFISIDSSKRNYVGCCRLLESELSIVNFIRLSTSLNSLVINELKDNNNFNLLQYFILQNNISSCLVIIEDSSYVSSQTSSIPEDQRMISPYFTLYSKVKKAITSAGCECLFVCSSDILQSSTITDTFLTLVIEEINNLVRSEDIIKSSIDILQNHRCDESYPIATKSFVYPSQTLLSIAGLFKFLNVWGSKALKSTYYLDIETNSEHLRYDKGVQLSLQLFPNKNNSHDNSSKYAKEINPENQDPHSSINPDISLFQFLNQTRSPMGARLLREWLLKPSRNINEILSRQEKVLCLTNLSNLLHSLRDSKKYLKGFIDLEKTTLKLLKNTNKYGNPLKVLIDIYKSLLKVEAIQNLFKIHISNQTSDNLKANILIDLTESISNSPIQDQELPPTLSLSNYFDLKLDQFAKFFALIEEVVDCDHIKDMKSSYETPKESSLKSSLFRDRYYRIRPSSSSELNKSYEKLETTQDSIINYYNDLLSSTSLSIKELHLENSEVHGIHLRVTKKQSSKIFKIFDSKKIKHTILSNQKIGLLIATNQLTILKNQFETAQNQYKIDQENIVSQVLQIARTFSVPLLNLCATIAQLDVISTFASIALQHDWVQPTINKDDKCLILEDMRHPLLEYLLGSLSIMKNNVHITPEKYACIITGPNMGGKSTYMKSVATCVILTQIGSFVPASKAFIPIYDFLFFRGGSYDSINMGMSSFMVEMSEVSKMIECATENSLLLIDELGRGTSINDGFALAWSILEELVYKNRSTVFFATHFHELNSLTLPSNIQSMNFDSVQSSSPFFANHVDAIVNTKNRTITMLYCLKPGGSDKSYGIEVAKLAGFPNEIIEDAIEIEENIQGLDTKLKGLKDSFNPFNEEEPFVKRIKLES